MDRLEDLHVEEEVKKKKKKKKKKEDVHSNSINDNKSAQMIFKTALRNHIDLTSIADNKANIMLSINALIITIAMPLLANYAGDNPKLIVPSVVLLTTCVASIIFATLATRPIKNRGFTNIEEISSGPTNLFFYGNFYKMKFNDYLKGVQEVMQEDERIDVSIISDLFYLGKALGQKFNLLRTCYSIFMVGITLSVIIFALSFAL